MIDKTEVYLRGADAEMVKDVLDKYNLIWEGYGNQEVVLSERNNAESLRRARAEIQRRFPGALWHTCYASGGKKRHAPKPPMPPHGRRRSPRKKPMKPQSVARRWREYNADVRAAGKMAAAASKPVSGETAKLLLQLGAALKE